MTVRGPDLPSASTTLSDGQQFDLHARYSTLAEILTSLPAPSGGMQILDVGAGRERLTEQFLPSGFATVTRTDVEAFEDEQLIAVAPGAVLPFADGAFDVVVAMDVLEHVRPAEREAFLRECLRVGETLTVIAAPIGCEAVRQAERDYAFAYQHLFKAGEPFLVEHDELGLPDPDQVRSALEAAGATVVTLDNVRLADWLALNIANLFLSTINDGDASRSAVSRLQNAAIPSAYRNAQHYRRFFIATRDEALAARLAAQFDAAALPDGDERPSLALLVLADELKRYATRYHGPTLEAVVADRELGVKTLGEVVAAKDRHIEGLQAVADGLAARVRKEDALQRANALIERQAAMLESHAQALQATQDVLQAVRAELEQRRRASLVGLARRVYRRIRGRAAPAQEARS